MLLLRWVPLFALLLWLCHMYVPEKTKSFAWIKSYQWPEQNVHSRTAPRFHGLQRSMLQKGASANLLDKTGGSCFQLFSSHADRGIYQLASSALELSGCSSAMPRRRVLQVLDFSDVTVPFPLAWELQHALLHLQLHQLSAFAEKTNMRHLHLQPINRSAVESADKTACDFLLLLQHPNVYTLGEGSTPANIKFPAQIEHLKLNEDMLQKMRTREGLKTIFQDLQRRIDLVSSVKQPSSRVVNFVNPKNHLNLPGPSRPRETDGERVVYRIERGGQVTWHTEGQLVTYLIFDMRSHKLDLHWLVDKLEQTFLDALNSLVVDSLRKQYMMHLPQKYKILEQFPEECCRRVSGRPGLFVGSSKICAIGLRLSKWISYHGVSLNLTNSTNGFSSIVACGLDDISHINAWEWKKRMQTRFEEQFDEICTHLPKHIYSGQNNSLSELPKSVDSELESPAEGIILDTADARQVFFRKGTNLVKQAFIRNFQFHRVEMHSRIEDFMSSALHITSKQ